MFGPARSAAAQARFSAVSHVSCANVVHTCIRNRKKRDGRTCASFRFVMAHIVPNHASTAKIPGVPRLQKILSNIAKIPRLTRVLKSKIDLRGNFERHVKNPQCIYLEKCKTCFLHHACTSFKHVSNKVFSNIKQNVL